MNQFRVVFATSEINPPPIVLEVLTRWNDRANMGQHPIIDEALSITGIVELCKKSELKAFVFTRWGAPICRIDKLGKVEELA